MNIGPARLTERDITMKFPRILALFVLLVGLETFAQNQSLSPLTSGIYFELETEDLKTSLNTERHQMLFDAFEQAEIEELLGMTGPFTVFAPSNTAFSQFSTEELPQLFSSENKQQLKEVLMYHIVAGNLTASKILMALCRGKGEASFTTIQGNKIYASIQGTDILLKDATGKLAKITIADSEHSNGVIHQIDRVIVPRGM